MPLTEVQEALGAAAYRMVLHSPHIQYGTQFDRFAWTVPPNPIHADCSGSVSHVYWDGIRVRIGADTGAIARDVAAGRADWVNINALRSGDIVMRRSGSVYNGGPDEHMGMFLYRLPDFRFYDFESAGSKDGVGYYPRPTNFWRDGVRYHDLGNPQVPDKPPVLQEDDMFRVIVGDQFQDRWLTNWLERRHIGVHPGFDGEARKERDAIIAAGVTNGAGEITWPQAWVNNIPEKHA